MRISQSGPGTTTGSSKKFAGVYHHSRMTASLLSMVAIRSLALACMGRLNVRGSTTAVTTCYSAFVSFQDIDVVNMTNHNI
jgi:hypothetical protein